MDREILRKQIWLVAEYCGVEVLTYTILSNHFHVLVRVPARVHVDDDELLRRYTRLYPAPTRYRTECLDVIREQLVSGGPLGDCWRERQLRLMGDLSNYMKLVKQRFSIWYNKTHRRFGTLWAERFKSVLVEDGEALEAMAVYIELNCVRAGLVQDPKDYRFCGYAEAVAGEESAAKGIERILGGRWSEACAEYREMIFGRGADALHEGGSISTNAFEQVLARKGRLPLQCVLRCRIRFFSDGAVLGGRAFVAEQIAREKSKYGRKRESKPRFFPSLINWPALHFLRGRSTTILS